MNENFLIFYGKRGMVKKESIKQLIRKLIIFGIMTAKSLNTPLHRAGKAKKDEFYTQLVDIEKELKYYKNQFRGKIVYCNCDDPFESNFFKYFAANFKEFGIKKLIATSYSGSPITGKQLSLFEIEGLKNKKRKEPLKIEITEVLDSNQDGAIDIDDVKQLLKRDKNTVAPLKDGGDFRHIYYICTKSRDLNCKNGYVKEDELIAQLSELINKKVVVVVNLVPRKIMGFDSEAMILAVKDEKDLSVLTTDKEVDSGSKIS